MLESLRQITDITISSPQLAEVPIEGDFINTMAEFPVHMSPTYGTENNRAVEPVDILLSSSNAVLGSSCSTPYRLELLSMQSVSVDVTFTLSATLNSRKEELHSSRLPKSPITKPSDEKNEKRCHLAIRRFLTDFGEDNIVSAWVDAIKRIVFVPFIINRDPTAVKQYIRQSLASGTSSPYLMNTDYVLSTINNTRQSCNYNSNTMVEEPDENSELGSTYKLIRKKSSILQNSVTSKCDPLKDESILIGVREKCLFSYEIPIGADPLTPPVEGAVIEEKNTTELCTSSLDLIDIIVKGIHPPPSITFRISFAVPDIDNININKSETQQVLLALACTVLNPEAVVMAVQSSNVVTTSTLLQTNRPSGNTNRKPSHLPSASVPSNVLPLGSLIFGTIYIESTITKPLEVSSSSKYIGPNHILLSCKVTAKISNRRSGESSGIFDRTMSENEVNKRRLTKICNVSLDIPSSSIGSILGSLLTRVRHDPHQRVGTPHDHVNQIKSLRNAIEVIPVSFQYSVPEKTVVTLQEGEAYNYVFIVKLKPEFAYLAEYVGRLRHSYSEAYTMKNDGFSGGHMLSRSSDSYPAVGAPVSHFFDHALASNKNRRCNLIGDGYRTGGGSSNTITGAQYSLHLTQSRIPSSVLPNQHFGKIGLGTEVHAINIQHKEMAALQQKLHNDIMTECEGLGYQQHNNLEKQSFGTMDAEGHKGSSKIHHERTQSTTSYIYNNGTLKVINNVTSYMNNENDLKTPRTESMGDSEFPLGTPVHSRTTSQGCLADLYGSGCSITIGSGVCDEQRGRSGNLAISQSPSTECVLLDCLLKDVINTSFIVTYELVEVENEQAEKCGEQSRLSLLQGDDVSQMESPTLISRSSTNKPQPLELRIEQKVEWSFNRDYYVNLQNKKQHVIPDCNNKLK
eukprot:Tbor_TRINITY_DN4329_c0_g1::TRINITY_DN4329_c0_g1_i1::g.7846::m.7846